MKNSFKSASAKPTGKTDRECLDAILRERPDLRGKPAYFPEQGYSAHTVIIGNEVFKTARTDSRDVAYLESLVLAIGHEYTILRYLQGKELPVAEATCKGQDAVFFGMTRVKGIKLDQAAIDMMTEREKRQVAKDIAEFMAKLSRAITTEDAKALGFTGHALAGEETTPEMLQKALNNPDVANALGDNLDFCRQIGVAFTSKYKKEYSQMPLGVSHGDLQPGNILYDPVSKRLSSVIDFGLCRVLPPVANCAYLLNFYKEDFVGMICKEYSGQTGNKITLKDAQIWACAAWITYVHPPKDKNLRPLTILMNRISKVKGNLDGQIAANSSASLPKPPK